jgi:glutamate synthase domain-containing protein 3
MNQATIDIEDPTEDDLRKIYGLIHEFVEETGSVIGKNLIDNWEEKCIKFVKIFPKDYKSVFAELEAEKKLEAQTKEENKQNASQFLVRKISFYHL